jgi:hypothetical protein
MYELVGTNHDRLKVLWRESFVVGSEDHDSVGCINELLDWKTHCAFHVLIIYRHSALAYSDNPKNEAAVADTKNDAMFDTSVQATRTLPVSAIERRKQPDLMRRGVCRFLTF